MKKIFEALYIGDDGKVSWTAVAASLGILLFFTWYVNYFFMRWNFDKDTLVFMEFLIGIFLGVRGLQRGIYYGTNALEEVKKGKSSEPKPQAKATQQPTAPGAPKTGAKPTFIMPCDAPITSPFRPPHRPKHHGIDLAKRGNVPIVSVADGVVFRSYYSKTYGHTVMISHMIDGVEWQSLYAHLDGKGVAQGTMVKQGDNIGRMGNTGRSSGQHLHFELHLGQWNASKSNAVDPMKWIK
jgi:murein DD-endopeptidase MepM/ murein hydrolase activator NlpD